MIPGACIPHQRKSQYMTDWSDHAIGSIKNAQGWSTLGANTNYNTNIAADANSISGRRLNIAKVTSNAPRVISWDRVSAIADVEVLALVRVTVGVGVAETTGQILVRLDSDGDPYYIADPARPSPSVFAIDMGKGDGAGGGSSLGNSNNGWVINTNYWIRLRVIGNTQKCKMWQYGTAEPSAWDVSAADSSVSAAGRVGFGGYYAGNDFSILYYSVGLNGATAPFIGG